MSPRSLRSPERTDRARSITDILRDPAALASIPPGGIPLSRVARVPSVTSLPAAVVATDGMEVYYTADDTNGIVWHLRYCAAETTYKWRYVGGPPLWAEVATQETTSSTTYAALATAGPMVTLPLAGDYMVGLGSVLTGNADGMDIYHSYDIGATGAVDADAVEARSSGASSAPWPSVSRTKRKAGLTAVALTSKYRTTSGAVTATIKQRWISALPVRVG